MIEWIYLFERDTKKAKEWLKSKDFFYYVYFETPFSFRYIGVDTMKEAKKVYNKIMKNKDLYGCTVSINEV